MKELCHCKISFAFCIDFISGFSSFIFPISQISSSHAALEPSHATWSFFHFYLELLSSKQILAQIQQQKHKKKGVKYVQS